MRRQIAYLTERTIDVYEIAGNRAQQLFSRPIEDLGQTRIAAKRSPTRRILVIGRSNFIRLQKRYPPAKLEKLQRAVTVEATDLFPFKNPAWHCRINRAYASHIMLDIWAWEREPVETLRRVFPFHYAVPEDLAFLSQPPAMHVYRINSKVHILACGANSFFDAVSCPANDCSPEDVEKFRLSLAGSESDFSEARIYGVPFHASEKAMPLSWKKIAVGDSPPCVKAIADPKFNLRSFRSGNAGLPVLNSPTILRFAVYSAAAYGISLFLTLGHYDHVLQNAQILSKSIDKEIALTESRLGKDQSDPEVLKKYQEQTRDNLLPLRILDVLAADLPEASQVRSLALNDGSVETVVATRDPLPVMKHLNSSTGIRRVKLKGSPTLDSTSGMYSCALTLEVTP